MKKSLFLLPIIFILLCVLGEIRCIYKAATCNWKPIGKAELVYTISACTGVGSVVGWFDIKDE